MKNRLLNTIFFSLVSFAVAVLTAAAPAHVDVSGRVTDSETGGPVAGAVISAAGTGIWAVCGDDGTFSITGLPAGRHTFEISCLGYVTKSLEAEVSAGMGSLTIALDENTLALEEVVVTAERDKEDMNTTMTFNSNALEHLQMSDVTDIAALLPGGKTVNPDLTSENTISVRDGGSAAGNAAFGTAIEIDGVRLGNNASFGTMTGEPEDILSLCIKGHRPAGWQRGTERERRMDKGHKPAHVPVYFIHKTQHLSCIQQYIRRGAEV